MLETCRPLILNKVNKKCITLVSLYWWTPDEFNSFSCAMPSFLHAVLTFRTPIINRETKEFLHICMHTSLLFSIFMFHINLCVPISNSAINKTFYSTNFRHCVAVWCAKPVSIVWRNSSPFRHVFNQTYHQSISLYLYDFSQLLNCRMLYSGLFPDICILNADVSEHSIPSS
jgi:hypothetical protein